MAKSIEKYVSWLEDVAADNSHGYDQAHRNGPDYDCSSLVGTGLYQAGFNVSPSSTTRNLYAQLVKEGFKICKAPWKRGDIHLKVGSHVITSTDPTHIVHASLNENGKTSGGKAGDQTGKEICTRSYYEKGWDYHLRYSGVVANDADTSKSSAEPTYKVGAVYTLQTELKVRTGAGTNYKAKSYSQLTVDGRKNDKDKDGALDKGTKVTCKSIKKVGEDIWIQTPSGWLAAYYKGNVYIK